MSSPKIIEEKAISMSELKAELSRIKKRDKELNFRANKTDDYVKQFATLDNKSSKELVEKIEALEIPRLKDQHIKKIVDILPEKQDDLKMILEAYPITVTQDNQKKILEIVAEFR